MCKPGVFLNFAAGIASLSLLVASTRGHTSLQLRMARSSQSGSGEVSCSQVTQSTSQSTLLGTCHHRHLTPEVTLSDWVGFASSEAWEPCCLLICMRHRYRREITQTFFLFLLFILHPCCSPILPPLPVSHSPSSSHSPFPSIPAVQAAPELSLFSSAVAWWGSPAWGSDKKPASESCQMQTPLPFLEDPHEA